MMSFACRAVRYLCCTFHKIIPGVPRTATPNTCAIVRARLSSERKTIFFSSARLIADDSPNPNGKDFSILGFSVV